MGKKVLFSVGAIFLIQLLSYSIIAKREIYKHIVNHAFVSQKYSRKSIVILINGLSKKINIGSPDNTKDIYTSHLKGRFSKITFVDSISEFKKANYDENSVSYYVETNFTLWGKCRVVESVSTFKNGEMPFEGWQSEYVWVLFKWFKVGEKSLGIS